MKIIGKSPTRDQKIIIHDNSCIILCIINDTPYNDIQYNLYLTH